MSTVQDRGNLKKDTGKKAVLEGNSPELYVVVRRPVTKNKDYTSLDITVATLQVMKSLNTQLK